MPNIPRSRRRLHKGGFTLTEIMIALGVMGVALGMAAAAFEAGIKSHGSSVADAMRSLIAENAIAIAQARLANGRSPSDFGASPLTPGCPALGPKDCSYPVNTPSGRGFILVGRQMGTSLNDYSFTVKPYLLTKPDYSLWPNSMALAIQDSGDASAIVDNANAMDVRPMLPVGTWVVAVNPANSELKMAQVVSHLFDSNRWAAVTNARMFSLSLGQVIAMVVKDASGTVINNTRINLLSDYSVRTSLRQAP